MPCTKLPFDHDRRVLSQALLVALASAGLPLVARAQEYPSKPVTLIVPFSAGGSSDALARSFARNLGVQLRQTVVVDNRAGAGGQVACQYVANAPADGHTLLFGTIGTHGIAPVIRKSLPYDVERSFAPVGRLQDGPMVLVVNPSVPAGTLQELIAYSRKSGGLSYGSSGVGSVGHLGAEILKTATGLDMVHIPYKGGGSAMPDLLGGQIQVMVETIPNVISSVQAGKIKALAITSPQRVSVLPEVPTFVELGYATMNINAWTGLFAPAGTPAPIVDRLSGEIRAIDAQADYIDRTLKAGNVIAAATTPAEFRSFLHAELARWKQAAAVAQVEPE